jgi:hypothetical protein
MNPHDSYSVWQYLQHQQQRRKPAQKKAAYDAHTSSSVQGIDGSAEAGNESQPWYLVELSPTIIQQSLCRGDCVYFMLNHAQEAGYGVFHGISRMEGGSEWVLSLEVASAVQEVCLATIRTLYIYRPQFLQSEIYEERGTTAENFSHQREGNEFALKQDEKELSDSDDTDDATHVDTAGSANDLMYLLLAKKAELEIAKETN